MTALVLLVLWAGLSLVLAGAWWLWRGCDCATSSDVTVRPAELDLVVWPTSVLFVGCCGRCGRRWGRSVPLDLTSAIAVDELASMGAAVQIMDRPQPRPSAPLRAAEAHAIAGSISALPDTRSCPSDAARSARRPPPGQGCRPGGSPPPAR